MTMTTQKDYQPEIQDDFMNASSGMDNMDTNLIINFDEVSETAFEALPAGVYSATINGMELKTSKAGNPMLSVTFSVVHEDYANRRLFTHFVLNNNIALARLKKFMINVFPDLSLNNVNLRTLCAEGAGIGREVQLQVAQRPYEGRMTNDVKEVLAANEDMF